MANAGDAILVHYIGWLYENGEQGAKFDSSKDRDEPFIFPLGGGMVMPDSFTHGTSEQRQRWLHRGIETGSVEACDTFESADL